MIQGFVAPGFEGVRAEFERNFSERGEIGGACAIYYKGQKVVDLWGGYRNAKLKLPWQENTLVIVFSTGKGMASIALMVAHSRGLFTYDARVADYWPEFAQNGKERITVRQLLAHQAGLCVIDEPLDRDKLADPDTLAAILAKQRPAWDPGTQHGYHALSLGWYESELIRRVDPKHRTIGQYFRDEVARPLGIEFYIGLPQSVPDERIAFFHQLSALEMLFYLLFKADPVTCSFIGRMMKKGSLASRAFGNPKEWQLNDRAFLALENPAYTGIGEARAIACAYSILAGGGALLGIDPETIRILTEPAVESSDGWDDQVLGGKSAFSLGYLKPLPGYYTFGSSSRAFGAPGGGGSFGFADPDQQAGYAYVTNKMGLKISGDPRDLALRSAFYACLGKQV
jgi:CubicO group peptidase (beta-lactamase class C family)